MTDFLEQIAKRVIDNPEDSAPKEISLATLYEIKALNDKLDEHAEKVESLAKRVNDLEHYKTTHEAYYKSAGIIGGAVGFFLSLFFQIFSNK